MLLLEAFALREAAEVLPEILPFALREAAEVLPEILPFALALAPTEIHDGCGLHRRAFRCIGCVLGCVDRIMTELRWGLIPHAFVAVQRPLALSPVPGARALGVLLWL